MLGYYPRDVKKHLTIISLLGIAFTLVALGFKGHRVVALVAQNQLTPQAKASIQNLLGNESLKKYLSVLRYLSNG